MGALAFKPQSDHGARTKLRVLVLDDDAFDRKRLRRWIERNMSTSAELFEAADLDAFTGQVASHAFDLVLLDYGLTDGTGLDAVDILRRQALNRNCYAVMVSGRADGGLRETCLSRGCNQFLSKGAMNLEKVADLLAEAETHVFKPADGAPVHSLSALTYWAERGRQRASREKSHAEVSNLSVLRDMLGMDLRNVPTHWHGQSSQAVTDKNMSDALRLFITDFLACDDFDFGPGQVSDTHAWPERK